MVPGVTGFTWFNRLGVRLVLLLGLALLPIGLIAMVQTYRMLEDAKARVDASLLGQSLAASANERRQITRTMGLAEALALITPNLLDDPEGCIAYMQDIVARSDSIIFAGFTDMTGTLTCGSRGTGRVLSTPEAAQGYVAAATTNVTISLQTAVTNTAAVLIRRPVFDGATGLGYVTVTLPYGTVSSGRRLEELAVPFDVLTFDVTGTPLSSAMGLESAENRLPANRALANLATDNGAVFEDVDKVGRKRIFSVVPVVSGQIFALGVWPINAWRVGLGGYLTAMAFPALMWLASLTVAYVAVHRLVIRHIRTLRRNIRTFGAVRRIRGIENPKDMPAELREVSEAFVTLTEKVLRDEADQENMLHEKDVLLKEVHHRVKNNLQLIASITSMQIRRTTNPEARFLLRRLQDRVLGLATVHRSLYQASVLSKIRADEVITDLARQLSRSAALPEAPVDFMLKTEPVMLYPDQAVPLSLLVTEAITNAYKYIGRPPGGVPWVTLDLQVLDNGQVQLSVNNSTGPALNDPDDPQVSGLGSQLIAAFVMQLGGTVESGPTPDDAFQLRVTFTRADFTSEQDAPAV